MKSWTPPTSEMIEKVLASVKKETDRKYFFSKLYNPLWIKPLQERGYFKCPPGVKQLPDGYVQYPYWPELSYLVTVAQHAPSQVVEIILSLPKTDNPRIYDGILSIALKLEAYQSVKLLPKFLQYLELETAFFAYRFHELLQHWATQDNITGALEIAKKLISFQTGTKTRDRQRLSNIHTMSFEDSSEPTPRFNQWEYQQILEEGVRPLANRDPYQTARILIDTVASMIRLKIHPQDFEKADDEDCSEVWCQRLDRATSDYQDPAEILVQTLTYACDLVYMKVPESIDALDQTLRNHRWKVFKRLRQYLYALHPNRQTLPWIREQIFGYADYSRWEYHFEFQLMVRKACEHFGSHLLSDKEQKELFDTILGGPSKEDFRAWMSEQYSEKDFQRRQRDFHRMQLRPFAALLSGAVRRHFAELEDEASAESITDESYSPCSRTTSGFVSYRSPKSAEELESFIDEELLAYVNGWDGEHRDKNNWLIEINISALAGAFQTLFKKQIIPDDQRLNFWLGNRDRIARPIYVAAMLKAMLELIKDKNFSRLDQWLELCAWILSRQDAAREEGKPVPQDESCDYPDWGSSRWAVVDIIDACVNKDINAPINVRKDLGDLLRQVCGQFDWRLDHDHPVLLNRDDPITEAINNVRSRALESLINFGFWVRRWLPEDKLPEVTDILMKRLAESAEIPLTRPERAILGMHFGNLCILNQDWAVQQHTVIFPQTNKGAWWDAFSSYILFSHPIKLIFGILRDEHEYALENLNFLANKSSDSKKIIDRLGQHLFTYYLWNIYPLTGDESLLESFYKKTKNDREHWAHLFDYVGRSLENSGSYLDSILINRIKAFFDWRFKATEPLELQKFTFWLQSECLRAEWRLRSYSKILDLGQRKDVGLLLEVKNLSKLLPDYLELVIECFNKITVSMDESTQLYIPTDESKLILKAGLTAEDSQIRENAERARENLLQLGRFDYLDIE